MMLFSENEPRISNHEPRYFNSTILFVSLFPFHVTL